ncbi:MAG: ornithine cyclodeaminase family protein [Chloroflexi bacterium]|nr:ornithine cyclodeaminase family protein [Chloroflexota bacterium]
MLVISRADIRKAVTMRDGIDAARDAFVALATGQAVVPLRAHIPTGSGMALFMPAFERDSAAVGVKVGCINPANPQLGLPTVQAVVFLMDGSTGTPAAVVEGTFLTQFRTGAAMGLGAELLALPDATTVALFGAGATAQTSLWAVCAVRPIREVRVVHPHAARFPAFQEAMQDYLGDACPVLRRVESPVEAVRGAQIVLTATTSPTPLFPGAAVEPGTYVGGLGSYTPDTRELDTATIMRSRLVVDAREAALHEPGDVLIPIKEGRITADHIWAELGEIAAGSRPGRTQPDEIFVFKSVGNAIQDLMLANRIYQRAKTQGLGAHVSL